MTKNCRLCNQKKDISRFSIRNKETGSRRTECKDCLNIRRKSQKSYGKWHKENKERLSKYNREHRLKTKYNMTIQQFNDLLTLQGGKCAICETKNPKTSKKNESGWHVDHCHSTGVVRGILCACCNPALGGFKDDIKILNNAISYLVGHNQ